MPRPLPCTWPNHRWTQFFTHNRNHLKPIPWPRHQPLSSAERQAVAKSIATFQLGENSEGRSFVAAARRYAEASGDHDYLAALRLFIAEEQRHARDLGRFMAQQALPLWQRQWTHSVFRCLRHAMDLELEIMVLLAAELVAKQYYRALCRATASPVLKAICQQILHDEVYHVHFQTAALSRLRRGRSPGLIRLLDFAYAAFYAGVLAVVWLDHGSVYRRGGYSFGRFWRRSRGELRRCLALAAITRASQPDAGADGVRSGAVPLVESADRL